MGRKRITQTDEKTGETLVGLVAYFAPKRQNGFHEGWLAMGYQAFKVAKMFTRSEDLRVFMALLEQVDYENKILTVQADIARDLGMQPPQVSRAIKRLLESGVIIRGKKAGINCSYQLNPELGWKGSAKNHVKALDEQRNKRMKAAKITGVVTTPPESEQDPK
jgi:predicted transcriptional regulator